MAADQPDQASLTWKLRQGPRWLIVSLVMPASTASRIGCTLLREFGLAARQWTPRDLDVQGEVRRFSYRSDRATLLIRRLK